MKKLYFVFFLLSILVYEDIQGQTNLFPPSGNVGIGNTNPPQKLVVNGNIQLGHSNFIGYKLTDTFIHDDKAHPHYGLQWIQDSQYGSGPTLWMSSFGGIKFFSRGTVRMRIDPFGNIGIGTTTPTHKLDVNGTVRAKEVKLEATNWPDYVFEKDYDMMSLEEVKTHIDQKGHLPGLKSAKEYEAEGVNMLELNQKLLEKIEELTLHAITQERKYDHLEAELEIIKQLLKERP